tara:strand:- start:1171 stop:1608 length:438 start_codon:yes stop_codon:yes gene_type:complete
MGALGPSDVAWCYKNGMPIGEIMSQCGVGQRRLYVILDANHVPRRQTSKQNYIHSMQDEMVRLYAEEEYTCLQVAQHLGISRSSVQRHIMDRKIRGDIPNYKKLAGMNHLKRYIGGLHKRVDKLEKRLARLEAEMDSNVYSLIGG